MSEYQHYEWQTVDRLLTEEEQEAVNGLSSHIDVSASRAVVRTRGRKSTTSKPSEPPVPAGLGQLSPALKRFLEQFDVPPCLVEAVSELSPELVEIPETDFGPLVA